MTVDNIVITDACLYISYNCETKQAVHSQNYHQHEQLGDFFDEGTDADAEFLAQLTNHIEENTPSRRYTIGDKTVLVEPKALHITIHILPNVSFVRAAVAFRDSDGKTLIVVPLEYEIPDERLDHWHAWHKRYHRRIRAKLKLPPGHPPPLAHHLREGRVR